MTAAEVWVLGFFVGLSAGVPLAFLVDRIIDVLTRPLDDRRH